MSTFDNGGSRVYDKRYYCPYCRTTQAKLPRHILTVHANETEAIQFQDESSPQ